MQALAWFLLIWGCFGQVCNVASSQTPGVRLVGFVLGLPGPIFAALYLWGFGT